MTVRMMYVAYCVLRITGRRGKEEDIWGGNKLYFHEGEASTDGDGDGTGTGTGFKTRVSVLKWNVESAH